MMYTMISPGTLPGNLDSVIANDKLDETFAMDSTHIILCDSSLEPKEVNEMMSKIDDVDGVKATFGLDSMAGTDRTKRYDPIRHQRSCYG